MFFNNRIYIIVKNKIVCKCEVHCLIYYNIISILLTSFFLNNIQKLQSDWNGWINHLYTREFYFFYTVLVYSIKSLVNNCCRYLLLVVKLYCYV